MNGIIADLHFTDGSANGSFVRSSLRSSLQSSKLRLDGLFNRSSFDISQQIQTPKRKRTKRDTDAVSISSICSDLGSDDEDTRNRKTRISSVAAAPSSKSSMPPSFRSLMTPMRSMRRLGDAIQKSLSMHSLNTPSSSRKPLQQTHNATPFKTTSAAAEAVADGCSKPSPRRQLSAFWHESIGRTSSMAGMNKQETDRQEAIFELYRSEVEFLDDINMVKSMYRDSMKKLGLLTDKELDTIFGPIDGLQSLHECFVDTLRDRRLPDGTTQHIGQALLDWVPQLSRYVSYCSNQINARTLLDTKKRDPTIADFLQRCQDSPFSRRLDLWSFLDIPRSRLVKYPLLFKSILKRTRCDDDDYILIELAIDTVEEILREVDRQTGSAKCRYHIDRLEFIDEKQKHPLLSECSHIVCDGILKNSRGVKLHVFLFDKLLVLTRPVTSCSGGADQTRYQVYRQPIPLGSLCFEDLAFDTATSSSLRSSFKSAFVQNQSPKYSFRVSSKCGPPITYILQAHDDSDKQHWVQCMLSALAPRDSNLHSSVVHPVGRSISDCFGTRVSADVQDGNCSVASLHSVFSNESSWSDNIVRATANKCRGRDRRSSSIVRVEDTDSGIVA